MRTRSGAAAALLVVSALAGAACANRTTPSGDRIDHPGSEDQVALRLSSEGGFVATDWTLTQIPTFTLYGDGRVIVPGAQIELYPGPALPSVSERRLTEDGIQAILQAAIDAGLTGPDRDLTDLGSVGISDAPTTVFTITANGETTTYRVYALGILDEQPSGMPDEEFRTRQRLAAFAEQLGGLDSWLPDGSATAETGFEADGYRLFVGEYVPDDALQENPADWPLANGLGDFGQPVQQTALRCGTVVGGDWQAVAPLAERANELTPWVSAGARYAIKFRPLLPDEASC